MSETEKKPWAYVSGMVQAFPDKETGARIPVKVADVNGQTVHNLTIKTLNNNLVDIALWSEFAHVGGQIGEGYILFVEGPVSTREYNGKVYNKVDAQRLSVIPCVTKQERPVVNAAPAMNEVPAAATAAAPAAAPAASPFTGF
jgi:hypothetical protein